MSLALPGFFRTLGLTLEDIASDSLYSFGGNPSNMLDNLGAVCAAGDPIKTYTNEGTGIGNFNQANSAKRPIVSAVGGDGKATLNFDGVDDFLESPAISLASGYTMIVKGTCPITDKSSPISSWVSPYRITLRAEASGAWHIRQTNANIHTTSTTRTEKVRAVFSHDPATGKIYGIIDGESFNVDEVTDISTGAANAKVKLGGYTPTYQSDLDILSFAAVYTTPLPPVEHQKIYNALIAND